ncbi:MAG: hypothetical protein B9S33_15015 [Pedosphaera sp. Tous-C6FEB]|nr:MAG: hypothetical protein B9S33_15015 [Pedosphaera sp. Tous-C6FEB]
MNATLEKELTALSVEEKAEVIDFLLPAVVGADAEIPPGLLSELERRSDECDRNPSTGLSLEEFEQKWIGR